jgi:hypothetical protein
MSNNDENDKRIYTRKGLEVKVDEVNHKIGNIEITLHRMDKTLDKQSISLDEHMRRTAAAEKLILELQIKQEPLEKHLHQAEGMWKMVIGISIVAGIVYTTLKILGL